MRIKHLAIALVFGSLAVAAAGGVWFAMTLETRGLPHDEPDGGPVVGQINTTQLVYRAAMARGEAARRGGALEALDLVVRFPDFQAPGALRAGATPQALIFINLRASDTGLDPIERPVKLYARFLTPEDTMRPDGLAQRRFGPGSPYDKDDLYMTPPEGRAFFALCSRPKQPPDGLGETCLTSLRFKGIDVQYRYSPDLLPQWDAMQAGVKRLLATIVR